MAPINIMSVIGSAVPASLRNLGLLACWYLVRDGEQVSGPLTSLTAAQNLASRMQNASLHA
ncbi:hypothetical protein H8F21_27205 [Pseudomonas sp. P66]|jgi:hypothetical protein|uniref:Filamentous hemagglutinin n=1 Tax=Pseudomonas arcuscaelestis TaxID=2710591 RepID=A0ABS2C5U2_9PSED|nr:hypothetical protein [Pseudomonas arcuscaelestis]MBM3108015.1 hypothetical protein [Pseudomonas arcuscaelestis]MBM3113643.1 hypothetical protein [Pseudomonas arcuscaelestis]MBM5461252.1 hypothetical protein [Pseudomonas arcuscaelestis]